jgi:hypothetical protein
MFLTSFSWRAGITIDETAFWGSAAEIQVHRALLFTCQISDSYTYIHTQSTHFTCNVRLVIAIQLEHHVRSVIATPLCMHMHMHARTILTEIVVMFMSP